MLDKDAEQLDASDFDIEPEIEELPDENLEEDITDTSEVEPEASLDNSVSEEIQEAVSDPEMVEDVSDVGESDDYTMDTATFSRQFGRNIIDAAEGETAENLAKDGYAFDESGSLHVESHNLEITQDGDIFGTYKDVKDYLCKSEVTGSRKESLSNFESHHLVPKKYAQQAGLDTDQVASVALAADEHMKNGHGYLGLRTNIEYHSVDELKEDISDTYNQLDVPEWGQRANAYIDQNRDAFESAFKKCR